MSTHLFAGQFLPGVIPQSGTFTPPFFDPVTPADPTFLDLDNDFSNRGPYAHGYGTIYQCPTDSVSKASDRACKAHAWKSLVITGTVTIASDMFRSGVAVYGPNNPPFGTPGVGGINIFTISQTVSISSAPKTIGVEKWFQIDQQPNLGREEFYDLIWPGRNLTGNVLTAGQSAGQTLDWLLPVSTADNPEILAISEIDGSKFGARLFSVPIGDYNFYLGSDVTSWNGDPATAPVPSPEAMVLAVRISAYCNCGVVRYSGESGYLYPAIVYVALSARIEPESGAFRTDGYYGSPPISSDTDGSRPGTPGELQCSSFISRFTPFIPTIDPSGVSAHWDFGTDSIGIVACQNYSQQCFATPAGGSGVGGGTINAFAVDCRSQASLDLHFTDEVQWDRPPT